MPYDPEDPNLTCGNGEGCDVYTYAGLQIIGELTTEDQVMDPVTGEMVWEKSDPEVGPLDLLQM